LVIVSGSGARELEGMRVAGTFEKTGMMDSAEGIDLFLHVLGGG
jgi:hypothetical protein